MRQLLLLTTLVLTQAGVLAQLNAGEVPSGATVIDPGIDITLTAPNTLDSAWLELDCDDAPDAVIYLLKGMPEADGPHFAWIRMIDDDLEICATGTVFVDRPAYYTNGQPLACSGNFDWHVSEMTGLGDFGGFFPIGPDALTSQYIALRRGSQTSWIHLSFDLTDPATINLQVHGALSFCGLTTSIRERREPLLRVHPSITHGEALRIESLRRIARLEVMDATGKVLATYAYPARAIEAPAVVGCYFIRAEYSSGERSVARFVRQ